MIVPSKDRHVYDNINDWMEFVNSFLMADSFG
jgi:hypothetical protein